MPHDCRLYLITPPTLPPGFAQTLAAALDAGDVAALQLRLVDAQDEDVLRAIDQVRPVAHASGVALILNNRPDLAVAAGCDGAHVGAADLPPDAARRLLGPKLQLGVSCYGSRDAALRAGEAGADYVSFGAFFPSPTKPAGTVLPDTGLLEWWSELMEVPVVAAGGITAPNCTALVQAGADFLAVCSGVWGFEGGAAAGVRALCSAMQAA